MSKVKGLDDFFAVLELVKNPTAYEAKVKELVSLTKQYTEVVEAVVALANVNDYTENIKKKNEEANLLLTQVKEQATAITNAAQSEAQSIKQEAKDILAKAKLRDKTSQQREMELTEISDILNRKSVELEQLRSSIATQTADLTAKVAEFDERQAKLKAALA